MNFEFKDYVNVIKKRIWWVVAAVIISCLVTALVNLYYIKPVYSASTKLVVTNSLTVNNKETLNTDLVRLNIMLINTYKEILKTPVITEKVAAAYPDLNLTAAQIASMLEITSVPDTQVMTLSIADYSQARAAQIVNTVSEVFKTEVPQLMKVDNVVILSEAKTSANPVPVKPKVLVNTAIALVVSLLSVLGLIFLVEYLDDTIKSEADVQAYLQLPVLVTINKIGRDEYKVKNTDKSHKPTLGDKTYTPA